MKNLAFFVIITILFIATSACQTQRRGVQFYSGDKNTQTIENQMDLTGQKKTEYEIKLRRLQNQRESILSSVRNEQTAEVNRLENENRRLEDQLSKLQNSPQRMTGDELYDQIEKLVEEISLNGKKLEVLYQSNSYPDTATSLDQQISQIEGLLLNLQINEDQALVRMNQKDDLDYFQGNLRNGAEAANAYMLMKWAQEDNGQKQVINSKPEEAGFQALIVNEWSKGVTVVITHSSGFQLPDIPIGPKSKMTVNVPFPGIYTCYFKRGAQRGNYVTKNINPRLMVNYEGESYAFVLTQRAW